MLSSHAVASPASEFGAALTLLEMERPRCVPFPEARSLEQAPSWLGCEPVNFEKSTFEPSPVETLLLEQYNRIVESLCKAAREAPPVVHDDDEKSAKSQGTTTRCCQACEGRGYVISIGDDDDDDQDRSSLIQVAKPNWTPARCRGCQGHGGFLFPSAEQAEGYRCMLCKRAALKVRVRLTASADGETNKREREPEVEPEPAPPTVQLPRKRPASIGSCIGSADTRLFVEGTKADCKAFCERLLLPTRMAAKLGTEWDAIGSDDDAIIGLRLTVGDAHRLTQLRQVSLHSVSPVVGRGLKQVCIVALRAPAGNARELALQLNAIIENKATVEMIATVIASSEARQPEELPDMGSLSDLNDWFKRHRLAGPKPRAHVTGIVQLSVHIGLNIAAIPVSYTEALCLLQHGFLRQWLSPMISTGSTRYCYALFYTTGIWTPLDRVQISSRWTASRASETGPAFLHMLLAVLGVVPNEELTGAELIVLKHGDFATLKKLFEEEPSAELMEMAEDDLLFGQPPLLSFEEDDGELPFGMMPLDSFQ